MPQTQARRTIQFIDFWTYLALGAVGSVALAGLVSLFLLRPLAATTLQAQVEQPVRLPPITVQPQGIGALRVDVTALLPTNRWVTYEVQLRDQQDQVLASAIKQAWNETGRWQEGGESGTWQEDDLQAGLDVQTAAAEQMTVVLKVLDYTTTANQDLEEPLSFRVTVHNGVIDHRYLWHGFWGTVPDCSVSFVGHWGVWETRDL